MCTASAGATVCGSGCSALTHVSERRDIHVRLQALTLQPECCGEGLRTIIVIAAVFSESLSPQLGASQLDALNVRVCVAPFGGAYVFVRNLSFTMLEEPNLAAAVMVGAELELTGTVGGAYSFSVACIPAAATLPPPFRGLDRGVVLERDVLMLKKSGSSHVIRS